MSEILISDMPSSYKGATVNYKGHLNGCYVNASTYSGAGAKFDASLFTVGQQYKLIFIFKKISGSLSRICGHNTGFSCQGRYVDGKYIDSNYNAGSDDTALINDGKWHQEEIYLTFNGGASDNNLYIQPNRSATSTLAYEVEIFGIELYQINNIEPNKININKNGIINNSKIIEINNSKCYFNKLNEVLTSNFYEY